MKDVQAAGEGPDLSLKQLVDVAPTLHSRVQLWARRPADGASKTALHRESLFPAGSCRCGDLFLLIGAM